MTKPTKLFFIRHAPIKQRPGFFPKKNCNAIIKNNQIKKLSHFIPNNCICYVSPLKRTLQTAKALSKYVSFSEIILEKKLEEQNFGDWSGKKVSDIWKILEKSKTKNNFSFISAKITPPNGESFLEQCNRISIWLENLNYLQGQCIVIITHAGTIRAILSYIFNIDPEQALGIEILHQSLNIFEVLSKKDNRYKGGKFRFLALNKEVT